MNAAGPNHPPATRCLRMAGSALVLGGPALALAYWAHPPSAPPETVASAAWIWIHVGFMVSLLAGVFGLTALVTLYLRAEGRMLGVVGYGLGVLSLIFVFGLDYAEVFIFPVLATEFPAVVETYGDGTMMPSVAFAFPLTGIAFVAGFLILCNELRRAAVVPASTAWITMLGVVVFGVGLSGFVPMIVVRLGATIFGLGLILLGLAVRQRA